MAWDWVQLMPNVVAMADPMAVITNLRFIDARGDKLPDDASALLLNEIVYALPWQREVQRTLRRRHSLPLHTPGALPAALERRLAA